MNKNCQKNNSGFTLIEMIVVVLIIGILSSTAVISLAAMGKGKTSKVAQKLVYVMAQTRQDSMTKDGIFRLDIKFDDGKYWAIEYTEVLTQIPDAEEEDGMREVITSTEVRRTEICDDTFEMRYSLNGLNTHYVKYSTLIMMFEKGSGSFWFGAADPDKKKYVDTDEFDTLEVIGTDTSKIRVYELTGRSEIVYD